MPGSRQQSNFRASNPNCERAPLRACGAEGLRAYPKIISEVPEKLGKHYLAP
jgi:hypothetical protein